MLDIEDTVGNKTGTVLTIEEITPSHVYLGLLWF